MRLRWWRRRKPEPGSGRDERGRLIDGDRVLPAGAERWADLLPGRYAANQPAQLPPVPEEAIPAQRRGNGGRW